ncbi:hypothetical protein [Streptomyces sp. NPDC088736]|uniref:hypothetical protein n=1 Tax=Streptomyces sp. NPDC088736 TaxID=3365881 RepID=UPI00382A3EC8
MNEPLQRAPLVGYDVTGQPVYGAWPAAYQAPPAPGPAAPLQPIVARPWGAYLAGGCVGLLALTLVVVLVMFLVFGFAILSAVLGLVAVALTICVLVLKSMWTQSRKG